MRIGVSGYYERTFTLPSSLTTASLDLYVVGDDQGYVYLNGYWLGYFNWQSSWAYNFNTSDLGLFQSGTNTLTFVVSNSGGGPTGLSYSATVDYTASPVPEPVTIAIDIKPQSCPNPLNISSQGVLPVAILGTDDFDVSTIDLESITLAGVASIRSSVEDVSTPVIDEQGECDCTTEGEDGFDDLTLKFDTQEIVAALGEVADGEELILTLTGDLLDGTPIEGEDCIVVLSKGGRGKK